MTSLTDSCSPLAPSPLSFSPCSGSPSALTKELMLENKRGGMPLGRSELQKMFDQRRPDAEGKKGSISPMRQRRVVGAPNEETELGQRLLKQTQKIKQADDEKEAEDNRPEFMKLSLKKV